MLAYCALNGTLTLNPDKPNVGRIIGTVYFGIGVVGIPICAFVFYVFSRPHLFKFHCYKLLTITTAADISNLITCCVVGGTASLTGLTYCANEHFWFYLFGYVAIGQWYFYCFSTVVLAFNRMLNFASPRWSKTVFGGKKIWIWIGFEFLYPIFGLAIDPTYAVYIPNSGGFIDAVPSSWHVFQNFIRLCFVTTCYLIMLPYLLRLYRSPGSSMVSSQIAISLQTFGVAILGDFCSVCYLTASYFNKDSVVREHIDIIGTGSWILVHFGTGFIYLIANKSVHKALKRLMPVQSQLFYVTGSVQPLPT
ncbi:hypothetical protein QR680_006816 [Steinernema hermaphroditum]|uniref:7TM GPCR serpentine receptor class x (Srx) domain-containing protein n=1 Tax=Steinernema hermaphroditum TaxID=289476 RepID=A0AA39HWM5_9BILA|nr:hypothetical protein QR680_006816 [Steinernema hermaphroditum]